MTHIALLIAFVSMSLLAPAHAATVEPIFGIVTDAKAKTLSIIIDSSGCTDKSYFSFSLEGDVLTFKRIMRDACKAMPSRESLTYSLEELGIEPESPFRLGNTISFTGKLF